LSDRKTILLVDDHTLFRKGLKLLLDQNPDFNVVGEAATIAEASGIAKMSQPQIVLMDIALPDHNGIEGTRRILHLSPASKVVVISMYAKMDYVIQALRAGAVGYLVKDSTPDMLLGALNTIVRGHYYFDPTILDEVVNFLREQHIPGPTTSDDRYDKLTPREQEVMRLVAQGLSSKEIAAKLYISPKTVENHRTKIMEKLQLASVVDLVKYAAQLGVIDVRSWKGNPE